MFGKKKKNETGDEAAGDDAGEDEGGEKGKDKKGQEAEAPTVGEMRRGDYMIHIYVQRGKDFKTPADATIDPLIECTSLGQKKYSTAKDNIGNMSEVNWGEHIFLEPRNVEKEAAEEGKITIKLMDKGFLKDTMIGMFEFDLSYIYFMKDHVLQHKWLAFSNPNSENYSEITGYLKVSISVACSGDEQVQLSEDDGEEQGKDDVLMPPQLNPKFYQVKVRLFQAQKLPAMDMGIALLGKKPKIDAYLQTQYKNRRLRSKVLVQEEDGDPINFNEEFWIPAQIPIINAKLVIKLMDQDDLFDETVGSLLFDLQEIIDGHQNGKFVWKNVYGSPMGQSSSDAKTAMNENPDIASNWKGRILMQILCEETEKPIAKVEKIDDDIVMEARMFTRDHSFQMIAEIGQGVALPANKKYSVKMIVGGHVMQTKVAPVQQKNYNRWNERFEFSEPIQLPYVDVADIGKVILLLMDGDSPVCYYIDSIRNFLEPNAEYKWIQLKPDMCVKKVKDVNKAGMISFKLSVHDAKESFVNFKEHAAWKKPPSKRNVPVIVRAYVYQCRDLPAADSNGTSDPFIKVWDMSEKQKRTQVIEDNNNPLYYDVIELEYEVRDINDLTSYPPFIFDVFDQDQELMDSSDDFLARAVIEPEDCSITLQKDFEFCEDHNDRACTMCAHKSKEIPATPRWHPLRFAEGEPKSGEVLVSFAVSELDYTYLLPADSVDLRSTVEFKEFDCNMLILGLRNLQSPGILPVKKAFVTFNIKSLVPPNGQAIQNIQTQPQAAGPNPTINTTMKFNIPLPTDPLYCPKLSCTVYDYIFKGWNQPMIGVFTLPIGELMMELKAERREETAIIENIITELEKILAHADFQPKDYGKKGDIKKNPSKVSNSSSVNKTGEQIMNNFDDSVYASSANQSDTLIRKDDGESDSDLLSDSSANKFKAKKRKGSASSRKSSNKKIQKQISKKLAGSELEKDGKEVLGPNEEEGKEQAANKIQQQLEMLKQTKKNMAQGGKEDDAGGAENFKESLRRKTTMAIRQKSDLLSDKQSILQAHKEAEEAEKRIIEDERQRAMEQLNDQGDDAAKMIIMPQYQLDKRLKVDREVNPPPDTLFIPLGWDEDKDTGRKHYRQYYNDELENNKEIFPKPSPFNTYQIKRGQTRGIAKGGFLSMLKKQKQDASGQASTEQVVGYFKGIIEIEAKEDKYAYLNRKKELVDRLVELLHKISVDKTNEDFELDLEALSSAMERRKLEARLRKLDVAHLDIGTHIANLESDEILKRTLLAQTKCIVRLYMISAFDLASRDVGSASDPYLYLTCNNKVYNERDSYQVDEANPKFYKSYDFEGTFPGCSPLKIEVYDYDEIFGDDLIGTTIVDLEDRYFSMEWQSLEEKPVEYRQIYHESTSISQGVVKCWVEVCPVSMMQNVKLWEIAEKPPEEFEVRICVLNCMDIKIMDMEGTSDVFFRGFFDSKEEVQETDTHYRNQDGKPDFQYRLVYRIKVPRKDYKFTLQSYDRDFFKSNDMIGEAQISLKQLIEDCSLVKRPLGLNKEYYDGVLKKQKFQKLEYDTKDKGKFWLPMKNKNPDTGKVESNGKVLVQIDVLPVDQADDNPVGKARMEPNHSPFLPAPKGRLELTLDPFKMFQQMVGPEIRKKIYITLCCLVIIALLVIILPNVIGSLIGNKISSWLGFFTGSTTS